MLKQLEMKSLSLGYITLEYMVGHTGRETELRMPNVDKLSGSFNALVGRMDNAYVETATIHAKKAYNNNYPVLIAARSADGATEWYYVDTKTCINSNAKPAEIPHLWDGYSNGDSAYPQDRVDYRYFVGDSMIASIGSY